MGVPTARPVAAASSSEAAPMARAIPKSAISKRGSLPSVRVLDENNVPKMRLIRTGIEIGGDTIVVLSGLEPGERILVNSNEAKPPVPWDK